MSPPKMRHVELDPIIVLAVLLPVAWMGCAHGGGPAGGPAQSSGGQVELVAGGGSGGDGSPALQAKLTEPFAVARHPNGDLYIAEHTGHRIRRVDGAGVITTVVGTGEKADGGDDGPGPAARVNGPHYLAFSPAGGPLYIADTFNNRVRTLDLATGVVRAYAGTGEKSFGGDGGPARTATFSGVFSIDFDRQGKQLYVCDLGNRRIRVIDMASGTVRTVAGNGEKGVPPDGATALEAPLVDPRAVAVDSQGLIYILERGGHALRVVDGAGKIRTVAGTGQKGYGGDGGPALQAVFNGPKHLTVDRDDSVLIVDTENHVIRRYLPREERIVLVAGIGSKGAGGIGEAPDKMGLARPHGVLVDSDGSLLISDSDNHRIVRIRK